MGRRTWYPVIHPRQRAASGVYGGPITHVTQIGDSLALFSGGQGAFLINHRLAIGGGGASLDTMVHPHDTAENILSMSYGGVILGYHLFPRSAIHFSVYSLFGIFETSSYDEWGVETTQSSPVVIPSVNVEFRITHWMQAALGVSYIQLLQPDDLFSFSGHTIGEYHVMAQVRFGRF